jgi:2,3-bisphosphoglycerate-independent phosphoglycerate mutase
MTIDDLNQYVNDDSVRGDLAREFLGVIADYQAGTISREDKDQLVEQIAQSFQNNRLVDDEESVRWIANAVSLVVSVA